MKKLTIFISLIAILLVIVACGSTSTNKNTTTPTYVVIKSTGLYSAFDINADMIAELSAGTLLVPANGEYPLNCDSFSDGGTVFTLCKVKVVESEKTGWVLKKWIDQK